MTPPLRINWLDTAKFDIRKLDRPAAMRVFDSVLHFAQAPPATSSPSTVDSKSPGDFVQVTTASCFNWKATQCIFPQCATAPKPYR